MSRQWRTRAKGPHFQLFAPEVLAEMIRTWVDAEYGGNVSAAAKALDLPQPTLHRLVTNPPTQITADTLRALDSLLTPARMEAIVAAVLPADVQRRLGDYKRWLDASRLRFAPEASEGRRLLERIRTEVPHVFTSYKTALLRPYMSKGRASLAMMRVLEPLLAHRVSGGVERAPDELSAKEFRKFVELGWAREEMMLDRDPEVRRAQIAPEFFADVDDS